MIICRKYRDVILTDYIDGELKSGLRGEIDRHLLACSACRDLVEALRKELNTPLERVDRKTVPQHLWTNIKSKVTEDSPQEVPSGRIIDNLVKAFIFPRWVPGFGLTLIFISLVGVLLSNHHNQHAKEWDSRGKYISYLMEVSDVSTGVEENGGWGTPIEQFFL